ncbi:flagellar basal body L-ring protein FlgH [uncultured Desulfuromonas sp.]|uniref:flagellar basal body L-ring protein FlgH n=1 Tax=uncultured Desulfuromonas sp. TaxID=181013 RepID=UPI002AAAA5F2|nr:flagellar basal body L-ring protein FlgH [uncultured Desulfuromonas sp.]
MKQMWQRIPYLLMLVAGVVACAPVQPRDPEISKPVTMEMPEIAAPQPKTPGSLWTTGNGSLFVDNRASRVGDILTVAIYEQAEASKQATTSTGRKTSASADITSLFGLESNIANLNKSIDPANLVSAGYTNDFQGSGSTTRKEDLVATLTTRVVEVLPNSTLRISGSKSVTVNHERQLIHLSGIVRQEDITPENLIDSKYVLDANIVYTGKGVIDDKQKPGWLLRLLDTVTPF